MTATLSRGTTGVEVAACSHLATVIVTVVLVVMVRRWSAAERMKRRL
jgi:hypothetical protein